MPRIEFDFLKQAETWIQKRVIKSNKEYEGYITKNNELILLPKKSTKPLLYCYVSFADIKDVTELFKDSSIDIFKCSSFDWNAERGIHKE